MTDAQATENTLGYFRFWLDHSVARICGKVVPLEDIVLTPIEEKGWWGRVTYRLHITEEKYLRECAI